MTKGPAHTDLPGGLAVAVPLVTYFAHFAFRGISEDLYRTRIDGEMGLTELATLIVLACAVYFGIRGLRLSLSTGARALAAWLCLMTLGAIYFLGEEASWGQHIFGWETPENWAAKNDQSETNLHNTEGIVGSLLDQVPRTMLSVSAFLFGFCYPLWRDLTSTRFAVDDWRYWYLPTSACMTVGILAPFASVPGKILDEPWPVLDIAYGELKELMIAQFILFYVASIFLRLRASQADKQSNPIPTGTRDAKP